MTPNPYANTPHADLIRLQGVVSRNDYNLIKSYLPHHGLTFTIIGSVFHNIAVAIRADTRLSGWTPENAIIVSDIVSRCTGGSVARPSDGQPVAGTTVGAGGPNPVVANNVADAHGGARKRSRKDVPPTKEREALS